MTMFRLILRNLLFHWRGNFAVFLGIVVGTAVLTGALLVGDSLRGSLRDLTLRRLDWVDEALVAPRFFREGLAEELTSRQSAERVCPCILVQATASVEAPNDGVSQRSLRGVTVVGVDQRFFTNRTFPDGAIAWLNSNLARDLRVKAGDRITLQFQKPSEVPSESPLGRTKTEEIINNVTFDVASVLSPDDPLDPFSLRPSLDPPRTAFVPLDALQSKLDLKGRVNAILAGNAKPALGDDLDSRLQLEDWGLILHDPEERVRTLFAKLDKNGDDRLDRREWHGAVAGSLIESIHPQAKDEPSRAEVSAYYRKQRNYLSLESSQLILEPLIASAALTAAADNDLRAAPALVYLANTIGIVSYPQGAALGCAPIFLGIPYSIVAALDPTQPPPLGPFLPNGADHLRDDEIILADWKESPLHVKVGDDILLMYFDPERHGDPTETIARCRLAGLVPLEGVAADPDLTPALPGVTDKLSMTDWNPPFPYDDSRIRAGDANEKFWETYRTTPKAYVTLAAGQRLWGSRFGKLTSIRMAPNHGGDATAAAAAYRKSLLAHLKPQDGGFVFQKVKADALAASAGGTDFTMLFLSFSIFLIVAALLLVGLLVRLNLDRRASEIGLLLATGFRRSRVASILLAEGAILAAAGTAVGCAVAILYAGLLLQFLGAVWPGGTLTSLLRPHVSVLSLVYGIVASLVVSLFTIVLSVILFGRVAPSALLAGQTAAERVGAVRRGATWALWLSLACAAGAAILLVLSGQVMDDEMKASTFFGSGMLLLAACFGGVWVWMHYTRPGAVVGRGWWGVGRLGVRNAARYPLRSLLTCGLLASAAFLIVAVEAFRRAPDTADTSPTSPSGGFPLLAETDLPLFQDLNTDQGRADLLDQLETKHAASNPFPVRQAKRKELSHLLKRTHFYAFRVRAGDDASCLNLFQPRRPRLLGVPASLIERGGFRFASTDAKTSEEKTNPWLILRREQPAPPAFGEQNTVVWMLHSGQGQDYDVPDGTSTSRSLHIDALLKDSIFQSGLLLSENQFLRLYPAHEGYNFFLIDAPRDDADRVKTLLEDGLASRGIEVMRTNDRLADYLAVENTYLSTFQALGGLGLILGSLGLAVVLLRGVWERRGELALLRALGFRRITLGWLILAENGFLLLLGLTVGALSAMIAVAPHLIGGGGEVPWVRLLALFGVVLIVGVGAGAVAVVGTLRAPLIPALRRE
jgi:ABC-type lipoprotein release transport system permease subunit